MSTLVTGHTGMQLYAANCFFLLLLIYEENNNLLTQTIITAAFCKRQTQNEHILHYMLNSPKTRNHAHYVMYRQHIKWMSIQCDGLLYTISTINHVSCVYLCDQMYYHVSSQLACVVNHITSLTSATRLHAYQEIQVPIAIAICYNVEQPWSHMLLNAGELYQTSAIKLSHQKCYSYSNSEIRMIEQSVHEKL